MPKAILELEMPESCWQCELYSTAHNCCNVIVIVGHYAICPSKGRRPDCPLKLVEEKVIPACNVTKLPCAGCNPCCEHREE